MQNELGDYMDSLKLYKKLYLIRSAEKAIQKYYAEDDMKTPMHMSMGSEAIAVGVCAALKVTDQVFSTYRSHALYLTKTVDAYTFFAEMYGKTTSLQRGKGGSMHLCAPDAGFMGTAAIVGGILPVAVGAAFANKFQQNDKVVAVFFGDGAADEGAFWESFNVACLMHLPILFVCEDNNLAVHTSKDKRRGYSSLTSVISNFNCNVFQSNSTDVEVIYNIACSAIQRMRCSERPSFLCLEYYRYLEHVGVAEDYSDGYRSIEELEKWKEVDPIDLQRGKLLQEGLSEEAIIEREQAIDSYIESSISLAKKAPFPDKAELYEGVFV